MPYPDPQESYLNMYAQINTPAPMEGFVNDYATVKNSTPPDIMQYFAPGNVPVTAALAKASALTSLMHPPMQERRHGTAAGIVLVCSAGKQAFELHSSVKLEGVLRPSAVRRKAVVVR